MTGGRRAARARSIAFVIYGMGSGGAERATAIMANDLVARGDAVTLITLDDGRADFYAVDPRIERIALDVATESRSRFGALAGNLRRVLALRRCLRRVAPDVVIAMMTSTAVLCAIAGRGMRWQTIGAERLWPPRGAPDRFWSLARERTYGWLDVVVVQTEAGAAWLRENTRARRIEVIPNALGWPIAATEPRLDPEGLAGAQRKLLLAVGRSDRAKGFDLLIEAFARIADDHEDWDLVILGDGPERDALREQVRQLGVDGRIRLPGRAGNIGAWYSRADLFVLSSREEGFPNVLLEAMASGCPVVATRCDTGPAELVEHEVDGILVPVDDGAALAAALGRLMSDPATRARYAAAAVAARERFSVDVVMARWEALFVRVDGA